MDVVGDRFRLVRLVGVGSSAIVWAAEDLTTGATVAVKRLVDDALGHPARRWRFEREASLLARFEHPHIVRLVARGAEADRSWYATTYARRGSVFDVMVREGEIPVPVVLRWASEVLGALAVVHAADVVHRDIKPENVLVGDDDGALLSDFGVALVPEDRGTEADKPVGTRNYMAPEQWVDPRRVGPASDLYGVGALIFSVLTRKEGIKLMMPFSRDEALALLPPPLRAVVGRATDPFPEARYPDAAAFRADLDALRGASGSVGDRS